MKILFFMDVYIFGGCEKMLKDIAEYLLAQGHQVDLLLIYKSESNTYLNQLDPRIRVRYIWNVDRCQNIVKRAVFWLNVCVPSIAASRVPADGYDWVINFKDDYQTNMIASKFNAKKISWIHNITEDYRPITRKGLKFWIADFLYRKINNKYLSSFSAFDRVVCVSLHAQSTLQSHCRKPIKTTVLYNYVDPHKIEGLAKETISDVAFRDFTYCYVGRLSAEKGVTELMEAFCSLVNKGRQAQLLIIGEGYQLDELKMLAEKYKCSDRIWFLGTKENPYPYIAHSDVVLCGSRKESFGLVVLEAILLNRWVVSTCCGGPEELIIDGHNGFLVQNYRELSEKMEYLYLNRERKTENIEREKYLNLQNEFYSGLNALLNSEETSI